MQDRTMMRCRPTPIRMAIMQIKTNTVWFHLHVKSKTNKGNKNRFIVIKTKEVVAEEREVKG